VEESSLAMNAQFVKALSIGSGLQEKVATNRSLDTAVAIKSRLSFLSVVITKKYMNVPLKAPGVRFADEGVIIFDLKQATDMNQPNACTETGLCLIPTPAYPFVEMPSGYFAS
jgi:hypothetical protein